MPNWIYNYLKWDIRIEIGSWRKDVGNFHEFHKRTFGYITLATIGQQIDSLYDELSEQLPYLFPSDIISPPDQLEVLCDVSRRGTKKYMSEIAINYAHNDDFYAED